MLLASYLCRTCWFGYIQHIPNLLVKNVNSYVEPGSKVGEHELDPFPPPPALTALHHLILRNRTLPQRTSQHLT